MLVAPEEPGVGDGAERRTSNGGDVARWGFEFGEVMVEVEILGGGDASGAS